MTDDMNRLRARRRRGYVGPWVPEPVETRAAARGDAMAESLTQAFLLLLERLTPDERAAFLLRTVFDYEYAEIGDAVGKSEVAARRGSAAPGGGSGWTGRSGFMPPKPVRAPWPSSSWRP